jgi:hypothetical protein
MTTPIVPESRVGYCVAADVYCTFTEYYGGGTVYGWKHIYIGADVVRGAGKTVKDLVEAGAVAEEATADTVPVDIEIVPFEKVALVEPVPVEPAAEPVPVEPVAAEEKPKGPYTVKVVHADFTVSYKSVLAVEVLDASEKVKVSLA